MKPEERDTLWDDFLKTWPPERVAAMKLDEYIRIGGKDTFAYWLEAKLDKLGSIWGGSAFKFGIFQVNPERKERAFEANQTYKTDGEYAWYSKYGNTREEAFSTTKQLILGVIEAARAGTLETIGPMKLGRAFKWKIASLYQDRAALPITPIFDKKALRLLTGSGDGRMSTLDLMRMLRQKRGATPLWEFYDAKVAEWHASKPVEAKDDVGQSPNVRYWLYAPGPGGAHWNEFYSKGMMAIGWDGLGDLSRIKSKEDMAQGLRDLGNTPNSSRKNDAISCWALGHDIRVGDVIFAKIGRSRIVGRGIVATAYRFEPERAFFKHVRDVDWKAKGEWSVADDNKFALKAITEVTKFPKFVKDLLEMTGGTGLEPSESDDSEEEIEGEPCVNLILYGPPGTGKTFALQSQFMPKYKIPLPDSSEVVPISFEDIGWTNVVASVLGLLGGNASVTQILEHPLFAAKATAVGRTANLRAQIWNTLQWHANPDSKLVNYTRRQEPFIFDKLEDSRWILLPNWKVDCPESVQLADHWKKLTAKPEANAASASMQDRFEFVTFHQSYSYEDFVEGIRPVSDDDEGGLRYRVLPGVFLRLCARAKADPGHRYAIFIDEINRGNIAKIFGELITLIETDKRCEYDPSGRAVSGLEVTLPYSGNRFGVPANLDIYGSMNTADRSIALLDVALRRRFKFQEVPPDPDTILGSDGNGNIADGEGGSINLRALLDTLNRRLLLLRDRDHLLGHSFFIPCKTLEDLQETLKDHVIPLLQEYFYEDFGRIQKTLGDMDEKGKPYQDAIITRELLSAKALLGMDDAELDERYSYSVSASENWTSSVLRRIYRG